MGVREIERFLGQWQPGICASGSGVVCPAAAGTRLDGFATTTLERRPPDHWPMPPPSGWGWGFDFHPPALREAQQAELRATSGIELAGTGKWSVSFSSSRSVA